MTTIDHPVIIDVLANDHGLGDQPIKLSIEMEPENGTTEIAGKKIEYSPEEGHLGEVTFTYRISDSDDDVSSATVTVTVTPVDLEQ